MLTYILGGIIILSVVFSAVTGNADKLSEAVLAKPAEAVELCIYLCGGMCFWGGLMRVAEKAGITDAAASLFSKPLGLLFPKLDKKGSAFKAICMNITANLLGLGNAATPLGIKAMQELSEEEHTTDTASDSMITLAVLNTASLTLIPTTALTLRIKYGSESPSEIIPAVWLTSIAALAVSLTAARIMPQKAGKKENCNDDLSYDNSCNNTDNSSRRSV
ncbi:MAG: hypothetical protein IJ368_09495 [Oscillospiraceae bacterium]|nr:hypothetical protein [Oscillospiraceae bacterium]